MVHVSNSPTLKIVSNILKYKKDIKEEDYVPEEPDATTYTNILKVTLTDKNGHPVLGADGNKIIVNQPWVHDEDKKERLWDDYNWKMKRALEKKDELEDGKRGTLYLPEG